MKYIVIIKITLLSVLSLFAFSEAFSDTVPALKSGKYCNVNTFGYSRAWRVTQISVNAENKTADCLTLWGDDQSGEKSAVTPCGYIFSWVWRGPDWVPYIYKADDKIYFGKNTEATFNPRNNQITLSDQGITYRFIYTAENTCW